MAEIVAPLTLDHGAVISRLKKLQPIKDRFRDGTGIGYAVYKTVSTFVATQNFAAKLPPGQNPSYAIENAALIVVTDGFQSTSPLDEGDWLRTMPMEDAAKYASEHGVVLYIVNIEPRLASEEFQPHRHVLESVAETTGGQFFLAKDPKMLAEIYREIDGLERQRTLISTIGRLDREQPRRFALYPFFTLLSLLCLGGSTLWETTIRRVVP